MTSLRSLPSVDFLLQQGSGLIRTYGRPLTVRVLRETLETVREEVRAGSEMPPIERILKLTETRLADWVRPSLEPVINATGVILHTNLGRAPLSKAAIQAMLTVSGGYSNLEFDLESGKRGSRLIHAEALLTQLTGSEAAVVVNNCASAVLLVLSALARSKRVVIARSQLVEIGGGFRVPDVMKQSGAKLVEVGTTNKVRLDDYEEALSGAPALFMRAHRSNFRITGFTEEPSLKQLAELAHQHGTILLDDLGSGTLLDVTRYGLAHEPTVQESLEAGADVVMFSGDKLLGGPQAGIILGRADLLAKIKKHPLARAVRADKTRLAALSATLLHYLKDEAEREIPIWQMMAEKPERLRARAQAWQAWLGFGEVVPSESAIGGGSLPGETLPTFVLSLSVKSPEKVLASLRKRTPPIIARTENNRVLLDPRTVLPEQEPLLLTALAEAARV
ncbi:MAG: L-seryl-tRNA(Sec) selenium transferase [Anaerolineales bacterium]|nr:L-seryl-tRNA(Sec) selenium transferase [Anaerolineales bacterium]